VSTIPPLSQEFEAAVTSTSTVIEKLEQYIDDCAFVPATQQHRGQVILALFSKALTVARAVCSLIRAGFSEEAFGLARTLIDIHLIVRYISNAHTEARAEKFVMFFAKDQEGWRKILPKYFPEIPLRETNKTKEILDIARSYKNPHEWSGEPQKTKSLALEKDTYEFDSAGIGITAEFDYEVLFKQSSHFVHSTVSALDGHISERGDTFQIRARWKPERYTHHTLVNTLAMLSKIFICGFRALRHEQPEDTLQELYETMKSTKDSITAKRAEPQAKLREPP
jgi:hypothetical protein